MGTKLTVAAQAKADKRAAMIAEAAYFAAEQRNFQPGDELSDWLAAEQAVDSGHKGAKKVRTKKPAKRPLATRAAKRK